MDDELLDDDFSGILEWSDGTENPSWTSIEYFKNAEFHREDGPAVVWFPTGTKSWFLNGKGCKGEENWKKEIKKLKESGLLLK